jgi:phosphoribosylcarboxyaminoimidazole (NCAIR) mutase
LPAMAKELVGQQVALIIAGGGDRPALAAKAATTTIPVESVPTRHSRHC